MGKACEEPEGAPPPSTSTRVAPVGRRGGGPHAPVLCPGRGQRAQQSYSTVLSLQKPHAFDIVWKPWHFLIRVCWDTCCGVEFKYQIRPQKGLSGRAEVSIGDRLDGSLWGCKVPVAASPSAASGTLLLAWQGCECWAGSRGRPRGRGEPIETTAETALSLRL